MSKQNIHIKVDSSIYLALKSKDVNISGTVNDLLRNFVETEDVMTDETKLLDELSKLNDDKKSIDEKIKTVVVKLQIVRERMQKEKAENDKKMKMFVATMKHNNPAREILK